MSFKLKYTGSQIDDLLTKIDSISNPMSLMGTISSASDFPTVADVFAGAIYIATAAVTDNDVSKTNTGLSFLSGDEIIWDGTTWVELGPYQYWALLGNRIIPVSNRQLAMHNGDKTYPAYSFSNFVSSGIFAGSDGSLHISLADTDLIQVATSGHFTPVTAAQDLGSSSMPWRKVYALEIVSTSSAITAETGLVVGKSGGINGSITFVASDNDQGTISINTADSLVLAGFGGGYSFDSKIYPATDDGAALGDGTHNWSDLCLASGATINYANSNVILTHTSATLTLGTGTLKITTPTNTANSVVTIDGTQTLTNKTLTSPYINEAVALTTTATKLNYLTSAAGTTGTTSTNLVFSTSPTLVTPILGVASATSLATSAAIPLLMTNGQLVNISLTAQTSGATTLTIPDFAGVVDEFTFKTKAQTLSNKTFVAPALGVATATSLSIGGATIGSNVLAITGASAFSGVNTMVATGANVTLTVTGDDAQQPFVVKSTNGVLGFKTGVSSNTNYVRSLNGAQSSYQALVFEASSYTFGQNGGVSIGGATIGTNALAVTGTALFNNSISIANAQSIQLSGGDVIISSTNGGSFSVTNGGVLTNGNTILGASAIGTLFLKNGSTNSVSITSGNATFAGSVTINNSGYNSSLSIMSDGANVSKIKELNSGHIEYWGYTHTFKSHTGTTKLTLDATGTTTFAGSILAAAGSAASPSISFSGDTNTGLYSVGADSLGIAVNGTNAVTVTTTGVGIGTTAPGSYKLNVNGSLSTLGGNFTVTENSSNVYLQSYSSKPLYINNDGNTITTGAALISGGSIRPSVDSSYSLGTNTYYWSSTYTDNLYTTGNVGIGLTNPSLTCTISSTGTFGWDNGSGTGDVVLRREAANTLALRNSTSAQTFNIYNTYTDASNYERTQFLWSSSIFKINDSFLGTGVTRAFEFSNFSSYTFDKTVKTTSLNLTGIQEISAATYTILATDSVIRANALSNSITLTLPPVATNLGKLVIIKKTDTSSNQVILDGNASELIEDALTLTMYDTFDSYSLIATSSGWIIV